MRELADGLPADSRAQARIRERARRLVEHLRAERRRVGGIDALMQQYDLSSEEGVTLMCLAEALLRIPDPHTQSAFIEESLGAGDWQRHLGRSDALFVNASTFGLMVAGRVVAQPRDPGAALDTLLRRLGAPVVRQAARRAMRVLGGQFVLGETIEAALDRAAGYEAEGALFSYDMLGEAARTMDDADRYHARYAGAIRALVERAGGHGPLRESGVSVKLSALHPRYEFAQRERVLDELLPRLLDLCEQAAAGGVGVCIDAEEADRLELSLDLIERVTQHFRRRDWGGFGLAVQAYQKRAPALLDWLDDLGARTGMRMLTRLVKGAYWDTEIKRTQEGGFPDYPVFTRKAHTDICYLACARRLFTARNLYPCLATHNAGTVAALLEMAGGRDEFEFQRLHGMGEALYQQVLDDAPGLRCRVYAPVGGHEDLLAYLVRRLLENGANTSFVNRIADDSLPIEELLEDPVARARAQGFSGHPRIPKPPDLFGAARRNSAGLDLNDPNVIGPLAAAMRAADSGDARAAPDGRVEQADELRSSPADRRRLVGRVRDADANHARRALDRAAAAAAGWARLPVRERADRLRDASDRLEQQAPALMTLLVREAGRSVLDAHLEVREAVDFLRYYAAEAERLLAQPTLLPGPTGESNQLHLIARGPFLCIAPWNFPLAIFTGQMAAALAAGCPVLAKPAEQTPLVAAQAVACLHAAGVPESVLHLLPGDGATLAGALLPDPRLAGVAFTGSTQTARHIQRALAARDGPMIPFIAETGGINAMIVDSTALAEQVTRDVMSSAFQSAGQRCSALRLLCVQEEVAERQLAMIAGAMRELRVGDPALLATDVGPVIDEPALAGLEAYRDAARSRFRVIGETPWGDVDRHGLFFAPIAFELDAVGQLDREVFGPVLHVVRWPGEGLDALVEQINALGYGLTLGLHSRSRARVEQVVRAARVGNLYVNRNQIGAVVGVQPFGGEGLSGTGPKAGGPNYLRSFLIERTVTIDTTAAGGNATLLTLSETRIGFTEGPTARQ